MKTLKADLKAYYDLTKFGAVAMIMGVSGLGWLMADEINFPFTKVQIYRFIWCIVFIGVSAAGALALNQWVERDFDAKMKRTQGRPIPSGRLPANNALAFGTVLLIAGLVLLAVLVNIECALATALCGLSYIFMYTPLKRRSTLSTFIGAIPGALLPLMGWLGFGAPIGPEIVCMVLILFIWQIPHALIIALRYEDDYRAAGMKQLPIVANHNITYRQILFNTLILFALTLYPVLDGKAGALYGSVALFGGLLLIAWVTRYYLRPTESLARQSFFALLIHLPIIFLVMVLDKVP